MRRFGEVLVTGGAGFIGSHLVDRLMQTGTSVRVVDNLSAGRLGNLGTWLNKSCFEFVQGDLKDAKMAQKVVNGVDIVFHLAANPEVRVAETYPIVHFDENVVTTLNVLEAMRRSRKPRFIVFFSSSTVYGEPTRIPTSEDYGPLLPISVYGASKLGGESLISSYCHTFGLRGLILRLANVVGSRLNHGVVSDFIQKLRKNPVELEILGDGTQSKSYLHITDLVEAVLLASEHFLSGNKATELYNVGSSDAVSVRLIAEIVANEMGLGKVNIKLTGGVDGGRGWKGDVKNMLLSVEKLSRLGWQPALKSEEAIRKACHDLLLSGIS